MLFRKCWNYTFLHGFDFTVFNIKHLNVLKHFCWFILWKTVSFLCKFLRKSQLCFLSLKFLIVWINLKLLENVIELSLNPWLGFNALIFFKTEKWYFSSHLNYPKSVTNNLQLLIRVSERHHRNYARVCSFSFPFIKQLITVRCIFLITTKPSEILSSQLLRFTVLKKHSFLFVCKNLRRGLKNQSVTTFKQKSIESK